MKKVLTTLEEAANLIKDSDLVTTGGATFHRAPMEFVRELVRQGKKNLNLVDREPAMDFDLLIGAGCVAKIWAGMLAFEVLGMAPISEGMCVNLPKIRRILCRVLCSQYILVVIIFGKSKGIRSCCVISLLHL
jgi:hypothetical protein